MARLFATMLVITALGLALAGPGDNSLIIQSVQEPTTIGVDYSDIRITGNQAIKAEVETWTSAQVYRQLLDGTFAPEQVTELATVENGRLRIFDNEDGTQGASFDLTLRDDLRWSDGEPITTADVAFLYEIGTAPGMPTVGPDLWRRLGLEVHDDLNFTVTFNPAQSSDFVSSPIEALPEHVMRQAWDEVRANVERLDPETDAARIGEAYRGFMTEFGAAGGVNAGRMVYSGAFVPTRWTPGSAIEFRRNPYYHLHPENAENYVQNVTYRFSSDTTSIVFAVLSGAVDVTNTTAITFDQAISPQIQSRAADRYDVWFVPGAIWEHLEVNQFTNVQQVRDMMLDDVRTRRAIIHALDRQSMVEALFEGMQPVSHGDVSPFNPNYNPDVRQYAYDPEESSRLLAELGWTPGPDGILQRQVDGRTVRFELEYVTTAGTVVRERAQQFLAQDLRAVGIDVQINNAPSNVMFSAEFLSRGYDGAWTGLLMFAYISSQAASLNAATYLCRNAATPANSYAGQNVSGACPNPEFDVIRDRAVAEFNPELAKPLYQEMQAIFSEELIAIPLFFRSTPLIVSKGVVNYVGSTFTNGGGYPPTFAALVGWEQNGAEKVYDQADWAGQLD